MSPVIIFWLNTLKDTPKASTVELLSLNTQGGTKTPFLTLKGMTSTPFLFLWGSPCGNLQNIQQLFLEPEWAIDSEAMRARGIIVLVKSN